MELTVNVINDVAAAYIKGDSLAMISQEFSVTENDVKAVLNIVYDKLRNDLLCGFDDAILIQLSKIDYIEQEAWRSYELSKRPKQRKVSTATKMGGGEANDGSIKPDVMTQQQSVEERDPNPVYLNLALRCVEQRMLILRLK